MSAATEVLSDIVTRRKLLISTTRVELLKRYAGSAFGFAWVFLNPLLFLSVYLFLYLVIFKMTLPGMTEIGFTAFVLSGLVPYIAFMEVANGSVPLIRGNIHMVKNLVFPLALIPIRLAVIALVTQLVGFSLVVALALIDGQISWSLVLLPLMILLQFLLLVGTAFLCSGFGMMLPDFGYFLNSFLMFMLFISPIGFTTAMATGLTKLIVIVNPFTYMVGAFRSALIAQHGVDWTSIAVFAAISITVFMLGSGFFGRLRAHLVDYE
jgi:lipopolysaccharide transport system permease protein